MKHRKSVIVPFPLLFSCSKNLTVKKMLQTKTDKTQNSPNFENSVHSV